MEKGREEVFEILPERTLVGGRDGGGRMSEIRWGSIKDREDENLEYR